MEIHWNDRWTPHMKVNKKDEVEFLTYPGFEQYKHIIHGFSTRIGGVSTGIYSSMNLSFSRGDQESSVKENYKRISEAIGFSCEAIVTSDQTHTTNVRLVGQSDCGGGITKPRKYAEVDGLITNTPGVVLATFYADCVPLFFVDPVHLAIGLSHSGWKGTVGKIGQETIYKMKEAFGTESKDLIVAIGPSICQNCYEVSEDVIKAFQEVFDRKYWPQLYYQKENGKYQLDLWMANRIIFLEAGIKDENIHMPGICTCCNPQYLYSHRASKGKRGNLAAFLGIR